MFLANVGETKKRRTVKIQCYVIEAQIAVLLNMLYDFLTQEHTRFAMYVVFQSFQSSMKAMFELYFSL